MKEKAKSAKDKIKDKLAKTKAKVKGKLKGTAAAVACLLLLAGCMDTAPASRYTASTVGDITVKNNVDDFRNKPGPWATNAVPVASARNPLVSITTSISLRDLTLASADSEGSTETQTATPTLDVRTRVDARYNDAIAGATSASKTVLGQIGDGATAVLDMMLSKKSGTVKVTKTDGTEATVECKDGQCSFTDGACTDGSCSPGGAK